MSTPRTHQCATTETGTIPLYNTPVIPYNMNIHTGRTTTMSHTLHTLMMLNLTLDDVAQMSSEDLKSLLEYIKLTRPM